MYTFSLPSSVKIAALNMKLMIILSVFACSYAAKLDRTYLPPANAATAGGAPGSITAPGSASTPTGQLTVGEAVKQQIAQPESGFQTSKPGFELVSQSQLSRSRQFGQSEVSGPGAGSSIFSQTPSTFSGNQGPQESNAYSEQYHPERAQASADRNAETLRYDNQNDGNTFAYSFETSNGISAEESGVATNGVQAQGGYSYTGDDGQQYRVTYTADENGYQPQGDHLPTPHPIPEEILRSIEENARAAAAGTQEGAYQPEQESEFKSQQYSKSAVPSYQGQNQQSAQSDFGNYQSGQEERSQYGAPGFPKTFAQQDNQYLAGSNQGPTRNVPHVPGFSRGQAFDQGPSPSTPTEVNAGLGPLEPRQPVQNQGQFGISTPSFAGPARQGQLSNQGQSGYEYNRPQTPSQFGQNNQKSEQLRPQQTGSRSLGTVGVQSQGPANSRTQYEVTGGSVGPNVQGSSKQSFRTSQGSDGVNAPAFGLSDTVSTPTDSVQGTSFPRPNGAQSYTPAGSSVIPSSLQGSIIRKPSSTSTDQGYVYGPGRGPTGALTAKNTRVLNGQEFSSTGPSRPATQGSSGSIDQIPTKVGSTPNAFGLQGLTPSRPASQTSQSVFSRPDNSVVGPFGPGASNAQRPFATVNQYQSGQGSASTQPRRPIFTSSGELAVGPEGITPSSPQGPYDVTPQYQQSQLSTQAKSKESSFNKPVDSSNSQGSSMPQSAPYQYNRPASQGPQFQNSQNQSGSSGPRTATNGSGNIFGAPRQPPSFSPEEGYKY